MVEREVEPPGVDSRNDSERPQIPTDLAGNLPLLDFDRNLTTILQTSPMDLGDTGGGASSPLHDSLRRVTVETDAKHVLDTFPTKIFTDHLLHLAPLVLRRIVKHAREHLLELGWEDGALHGDGLADLKVQPAILAEQIEYALGTATVHVSYAVADPWIRPEIELVVHRNEETGGEGSQAAGQAGVVYPGINGVEDGEGDG
ncbi:ABC1-domain-containing protein [Hortaea werneckii]|nr:ABC1-domain-containing protein [Hortaea werneckii]